MSEPRATRRSDGPRVRSVTKRPKSPSASALPAGDRLVAAQFVSRPSRFIVRAGLSSGHCVDAHLADPGRLIELLRPGAALRLRPAPPEATRRTAYTVALVRSSIPPRMWVSVETTRANSLAEGLLATGAVPGLEEQWKIHREVRHGNSRFDFLLELGLRRLWVEVKSVTLVQDGLGLFPDAPTKRGRRHVEELTHLVREGESAMILFVAQRGDASAVAPHAAIDPAFAAALVDAQKAGVALRAAGFRFDARGRVSGCRTLSVLASRD